MAVSARWLGSGTASTPACLTKRKEPLSWLSNRSSVEIMGKDRLLETTARLPDVRLLLVQIAEILLLLVSPIFMLLLQRMFPLSPRPKSHLLALQGLIVLVMQAVFIGVVGDGGRLEIALIALFCWQALGIIALLRAPSVEFETAFRDQVIREEWYKDRAWQGAMEVEIEQMKDQIAQMAKNSDVVQDDRPRFH